MKNLKPLSFMKLLPLTLLALASQAALADGAEYDYPQPVHSAVSRAEVQQQAIAARNAGLTVQGEAQAEMPQAFASTLSRAQVRAEATEARRLGLIAQGEMPVREATPAEAELIRLAGVKAQQQQLQFAAR